jgi:hypothetical protein
MSLDFPNRADWLAVRKQTPVQKRYTHWSVDGGRAFTFRAGRNIEKRKTHEKLKAQRLTMVKYYLARGRKAPKAKSLLPVSYMERIERNILPA